MLGALRATVEGLEEFLAMGAVEDRPIEQTLEGFAERARAGGISVFRVMAGWRLLNPQFASSSLCWQQGEGLTIERFRQGEALVSEDYKRSTIFALLNSDATEMRHRLAGANAPFEFPIFERLAALGMTDYFMCLVAFGKQAPGGQPMVGTPKREVPGAGIVLSFASDREGGFTDEEVCALKRLRYMLALASRTALDSDMRQTLATTYLGRATGARVLGGEIARGDGEVVDAIIWYCDLRGSTALCERLGAQAYLPVLNDYFEATAGPVVKAGGEVLDFIGDAVLAIFPPTPEGFAGVLAGTKAACEEVMALPGQHSALADRTCLSDMTGIAIATGTVVYGNIGIAERLTFSVIGPTVNAVARLEQLTKVLKEPLLVSADVAAQMEWDGGWRDLGAFALEGFSSDTHVFAPKMEPVGPAAQASSPSSKRSTSAASM
ncbi:MAG: adenylate/guanylate cyclase domain-containing protein [Pseudomonadota bacterium]